ncbi:MAG: enoyl-CoA hydratase-related protein, partial [Chloroflexota bacterium]
MTSIRVARVGPNGVVARVTLARPEAHNAFDASVIAELAAAFNALAREDSTTLRAVVLAGEGPSFCAGADIAWMRAAMQLDIEGNEQDAMAMADMFEVIDTCPVPVIARVQRAALGGGMGLCAVSDLVIAESGTKFGFTETRLGILPAVIAPFVIA